MNQQAFDTRWVINRNKALASAGEGIIEARKLLDQLDEIYRDASMGKVLELNQLVSLCHALGEAKNTILIGFVESSTVPQTKSGTLKVNGPETIGCRNKVITPLIMDENK